MTRSRLRKLKKFQKLTSKSIAGRGLPVASALLACMQMAYGADTGDTATLDEVVVTAQKRTENLQDVPISIQAMGTKKLEELNVKNFDDYAKYLPSLSFQTAGPSFEHSYMRGVVSGGDGNHSGSMPSVGMYLDEQPITTIDGNLDIHVYDIERVEALNGPQGTLYGASSESGTIRIITNKPDINEFSAAFDVEGNNVAHGNSGYTAEGYINLPLTSIAAIRLVGWDEHDGGYINNVPGSVTFPTSGITFTNAPFVKNNYNDVDTQGGRLALKVQLGDSWSILPQVMGQDQHSYGNFAYNPAVGDLDVQHYFYEYTHDSWVQSALTVNGKVSDFDIVYAGAYLTRNTHEASDYTDYSYFYDKTYGSGAYFTDNAGKLINPAQQIIGTDHYSKISNELRIASPKENRFRFTSGVFFQRQVHNILQNYLVDNGGDALSDSLSIPGWPGTLWLTDQQRVDRDQAIFSEFSFDLTQKLTLNTGLRYYTYDNTLQGFYGFNSTFSSSEGVATCFTSAKFRGAPCQDLNGRTTGSGTLPKVNLTYKVDSDKMVYATYSKGYRPGGVNRNGGGTEPPYQADFLTNYELGWKTTWDDNRLRFNGAIYQENWKNFQFSFLGANALTIIANAGDARIYGLESDVDYVVTPAFTVSGSLALIDAYLTQEYCDSTPAQCAAPGYNQYAPEGQQLPVTPKIKANIIGRYNFDVGDYKATLQNAFVYVGVRTTDLRYNPNNELGNMPGYAEMNWTATLEKNKSSWEMYINNVTDRRGILDRYAECEVFSCGQVAVYNVVDRPRTIGVRYSQKF
jgi:iron complex outermembrane recepter protein